MVSTETDLAVVAAGVVALLAGKRGIVIGFDTGIGATTFGVGIEI